MSRSSVSRLSATVVGLALVFGGGSAAFAADADAAASAAPAAGATASGVREGGEDPAGSDPTPVDPTPVDPVPVDPTPVDPQPVDPQPVDPSPVDPAPVDPTPVDPAPVDPAPVDPAPVDPSVDVASGGSEGVGALPADTPGGVGVGTSAGVRPWRPARPVRAASSRPRLAETGAETGAVVAGAAALAGAGLVALRKARRH